MDIPDPHNPHLRRFRRQLNQLIARRRSPAARRLFSEFNALYFGGRLPSIRVRFSAASRHLEGRKAGDGRFEVVNGYYSEWTPMFLFRGRGRNTTICRNEAHEPERIIVLSVALAEDEVPRVLIHEMIHATGLPHGEAFAAETRRIQALGGPVLAEDCGDRDVAPGETTGPIRDVSQP